LHLWQARIASAEDGSGLDPNVFRLQCASGESAAEGIAMVDGKAVGATVTKAGSHALNDHLHRGAMVILTVRRNLLRWLLGS
jgi:hypothetical protein